MKSLKVIRMETAGKDCKRARYYVSDDIEIKKKFKSFEF